MTKDIFNTVALSVAATLILLTGCGGGSDTTSSGSGSSNTTKAFTGVYVDGAVGGVSYVCGNQSGVTDADGKFTFQEGQNCTFSLGNIVLRRVEASNLVDQIKILENNVSVAQMLQTLDKDGNPSNGITITPEVIAAVKTANITTPPAGDEAAVALYNAVKNVAGYTGSAKTIVQTQAHLAEAQTPIIKTFVAGKTFYAAFSESPSDKVLFSIAFNADATSNVLTPLKYNETAVPDGNAMTQTIQIVGTKIMLPDDMSEEYVGQTVDYVITRAEDGTLSRLYFSKAKAEAYYATLSPVATVSIPSAPSTFDAKTLLAGKTFYDVGRKGSDKWISTLSINAQGTTMFPQGSPSDTITLSGNRISVPSVNEYADIQTSNADYIGLLQNDGSVLRWYYDQAKAQAYYNTL